MGVNKSEYSLANEEQFVLLLGCWHSPAPHLVLPLRPKSEYIAKLKTYLAVNGKRTDTLGKHGCAFAIKELQNAQSGK
jgi:hypothetical protein